jgi:hypothetical protein
VSLVVREMALDEVDLVIDYFYGSTPEHLETMGVDPTRLPTREDWWARYVAEYGKSVQERSTLLVIWELDGVAFGFSSPDKIVYGKQAHMHLHIVDPQRRRSGIGAACVRETVELYFNALALRFLFCEPNAFNMAPNRTLQSVGPGMSRPTRRSPALSTTTRRSPAGYSRTTDRATDGARHERSRATFLGCGPRKHGTFASLSKKSQPQSGVPSQARLRRPGEIPRGSVHLSLEWGLQ